MKKGLMAVLLLLGAASSGLAKTAEYTTRPALPYNQENSGVSFPEGWSVKVTHGLFDGYECYPAGNLCIAVKDFSSMHGSKGRCLVFTYANGGYRNVLAGPGQVNINCSEIDSLVLTLNSATPQCPVYLHFGFDTERQSWFLESRSYSQGNCIQQN